MTSRGVLDICLSLHLIMRPFFKFFFSFKIRQTEVHHFKFEDYIGLYGGGVYFTFYWLTN